MAIVVLCVLALASVACAGVPEWSFAEFFAG